MEVAVDLDKVVVTFGDVDAVDVVTLRVIAPPTASALEPASVHRLGDVLAATNVGRLEQGPVVRAWINPDAARFHAAGQVGPDWGERLEIACTAAAAAGGFAALEASVLWPSST